MSSNSTSGSFAADSVVGVRVASLAAARVTEFCAKADVANSDSRAALVSARDELRYDEMRYMAMISPGVCRPGERAQGFTRPQDGPAFFSRPQTVPRPA